MKPTIPFIRPKFPEPEVLNGYIRRIYDNNYYSNNGPLYYEFKAEIEKYLNQDTSAVIVANATLGLMMAIEATIKKTNPKKKYIAVTSFTFAAGPLSIKWCGFEPIFFDIGGESIQPSLESFQKVLDEYSDELAGVLLLNNFGVGNEEIEKWEELAASHGLPVVIDSAPGFGAMYPDGKRTGGRGVCEVFSLHATKPFGIGEGGLITTRDPELAKELESLKNFGFNEHKQTVRMGINAKITEIDCAIGLCLLKEYPATLQDRHATYKRFQANMSGEDITFLPRAETSAIQFVTILVDAAKRPGILKALKAGGVEFGTYYAPAVHTFPFFEACLKTDLQNTVQVSEKIISLPLHPNMDPSTVDYICNIIVNELAGSEGSQKKGE